MPNHTCKLVELPGSSFRNRDNTIHNVTERASRTLRNMNTFEITKARSYLQGDKVAHFQVKPKVVT